MEPVQKSDSCQLQLEKTQKHPFPTHIMLRLFSFDIHAIRNSPWPQEHLSSLSQSTPCWNLNRKSHFFIPKGPWEPLWLVQAHQPVFGSVKLAPIKYEKSFVQRHLKSDEGLFWKSTLIRIIFGSLDFQLGNPNRWKIFRGENMPISTINNVMFKWFWTIFSLGSPSKIVSVK